MKRLLTTAFIACSMLSAPVLAQTPNEQRMDHSEHREERKDHREEHRQ